MPKGNTKPKEASITDVLVAINSFASEIESELVGIKTKQSLDMLEIKTALSKAIGRLNSLPTKDYLDEKVGSLRGDLVTSQHRTNKAMSLMIKSLERKKVFQPDEAKSILKLVELQQF